MGEFDKNNDGLLDEEKPDPEDPSFWDPMGKKDVGAEGMKAGDEAVMADDPAKVMEKDGEPGPGHDADPETEGEIDELFSHAREVEIEEPVTEFDPLDDL